MSETQIDYLLGERGLSRQLGAWVIGMAFGREGRTLHIGLGDGTVHVVDLATRLGEWTCISRRTRARSSRSAPTARTAP